MAKHKFLANVYHDHRLVGPTPPAQTDTAEVSDEMAKIFADAGVILLDDKPHKSHKKAKHSIQPEVSPEII